MATDKWTTARQLAQTGIAVLPLHNIVNGRCTCKEEDCARPGKHPRWNKNDIPNGVVNATTDPRTINTWAKRWPNANIGIATGKVSGLVVVDLDGPAGLDSIGLLLSDVEINSTLQVSTGSGGWHLYFRHPGTVVPNGVKILPGVDIRGDGGYVVAPPSDHITGNTYTWYNDVPFSGLSRFPNKIRETVEAKSAAIAGANKLKAEDWGEILSEGNRNQELARRIGKLLSSDVPPNIVRSTMLEYNATYCSPPLDVDEIDKIISSLHKRDTYRKEQKEQTARREEAAQKEPSPFDSGKSFNLLTLNEAFHKYGGHETEWTIPGWLPKSTNGLVVAPPGSYKTWILADMATAVAGARKFLGQIEIENPGPVFIVQQEDYLPILMGRIAVMLGAPEVKEDSGQYSVQGYSTEWPIFIHDERKLHFGNRSSVEGLADAVAELRPSLVILDPLYSAVDMKEFMAEAAQQMMVLKDLRDRYGCSFMLAHHTTKGKNEGGRARDDLWGSQFLNAWLETGWQLRLGEEAGVVQTTRHFKVVPNPSVIDLKFNITDWDYRVDISDPDNPSSSAAKEKPAPAKTNAKLISHNRILELGGMYTSGHHIPDVRDLGVTTKYGKCYVK